MQSKMTKIKKEHQVEFIVHNQDGHPTGIKDIIQAQIKKPITNNAIGIDNQIDFLETVYKINDFQICCECSKSMIDLLNNGEMSSAKIKKT